MSGAKSGLVLLPSFMNAAERLPTEAQRWRFIKKLFLYRTREIPFVAADEMEALAWDLIKPSIDASAARHAAAIENGKKGGNPNFQRGKQNPYFSASKRKKITQNNQDKDTDFDREVDKTLSIERGHTPSQTADGVKAPPPVPEEQRTYIPWWEEPEQSITKASVSWEDIRGVPEELRGKFDTEKEYDQHLKDIAIAKLGANNDDWEWENELNVPEKLRGRFPSKEAWLEWLNGEEDEDC